MLGLFRDVDILLAPATPCPAPLIGQEAIDINGEAMPVRPHLGIYTQPISFLGLPVVVVPLRPDDGLPIGVQIIAAPWREADALRVAGALERAALTNAAAANT